jgi:hypothetical protein
MILRGLRLCTAKRTKTFWLGLHELDTVDARSRNAFGARVAARIRRIAV